SCHQLKLAGDLPDPPCFAAIVSLTWTGAWTKYIVYVSVFVELHAKFRFNRWSSFNKVSVLPAIGDRFRWILRNNKRLIARSAAIRIDFRAARRIIQPR